MLGYSETWTIPWPSPLALTLLLSLSRCSCSTIRRPVLQHHMWLTAHWLCQDFPLVAPLLSSCSFKTFHWLHPSYLYQSDLTVVCTPRFLVLRWPSVLDRMLKSNYKLTFSFSSSSVWLSYGCTPLILILISVTFLWLHPFHSHQHLFSCGCTPFILISVTFQWLHPPHSHPHQHDFPVVAPLSSL